MEISLDYFCIILGNSLYIILLCTVFYILPNKSIQHRVAAWPNGSGV